MAGKPLSALTQDEINTIFAEEDPDIPHFVEEDDFLDDDGTPVDDELPWDEPKAEQTTTQEERMDTLQITGSLRGYQVVFTMPAPEPSAVDESYVDGLVAYLEGIGIQPPPAPVAVAPTVAESAPNAARPAASGDCPIHGAKYKKVTTFGVICTGMSDKQEPWSKDAPSSQGKYFCKFRWKV